MATNYPGAIDSLTNPGAGDGLDSPSHAGQHTNANDAIEAVQTELGTDPAGASATVKARFEAIEADNWVTSARIAADAVGSSEIAANAVGSSELADNAVDTAAIANGAVTAEKILIGAATVGSGTGTPEGVVTAAPGSTWLQIGDAVTVSGNMLWRKATGTGNTGWVPEGALADTGWRNITSAVETLAAGLTWTDAGVGYVASIRRVGTRIIFGCGRITHAGGWPVASDLYIMPSGWRPKMATVNTYARHVLTAATDNYTPVGYLDPNGYSNILYVVTSATTGGGYLSWDTTDAWPTSLPGSAV